MTVTEILDEILPGESPDNPAPERAPFRVSDESSACWVLRPLADLPDPDPTPRPRRPFSRPRIAGLIAGLKSKSCRSDPYKKTDGRDNNRPPGNVVVSSSPDPGILAQKRSPSRPSADEVAAAEAAVRAYAERHAVRSMGALLTAAIKGKWTPPAPVRDHPSERPDRPVRVVRAPQGFALRRDRSAAGVETTGARRPMSQGGPSALLHAGQKAPTASSAPCTGAPGIAPVSAGLAALLSRCEARRGVRP